MSALSTVLVAPMTTQTFEFFCRIKYKNENGFFAVDFSPIFMHKDYAQMFCATCKYFLILIPKNRANE